MEKAFDQNCHDIVKERIFVKKKKTAEIKIEGKNQSKLFTKYEIRKTRGGEMIEKHARDKGQGIDKLKNMVWKGDMKRQKKKYK